MSEEPNFIYFLILGIMLALIFGFVLSLYDDMSEVKNRTTELYRIVTEEGYYEALSAWKQFEEVEE